MLVGWFGWLFAVISCLFVFTVRCGGFVLVLAVGLAVYVGLFYFVSFSLLYVRLGNVC